MAFKPVDAYDERGQRWYVCEGDPAWVHVHALWLRGVREIVLPRRTMITGELVDVSVPRTMAAWDTTNEAAMQLLRRYVRVTDCVEWLRNGSAILVKGGQDRDLLAVASKQD